MTRRIAGFQLKIGTLARTGSDQFNKPTMPADAGHWQRDGRQNGDAPSRHGCGRLAEVGCVGLTTPSSEGDAYGACAFGCELQPSRGCHSEPGDLSDD